LPALHQWKLNDYIKHFDAKPVQERFRYNSGENTEWLSVEEIRALIVKHVDPTFKP
jgi:hypothetical protein